MPESNPTDHDPRVTAVGVGLDPKPRLGRNAGALMGAMPSIPGGDSGSGVLPDNILASTRKGSKRM